MRVRLAMAAAIGLAAAPCAWDDDPREAPAILALLSRPRPLLSSVAPFPHRPAEASAAVTTPNREDEDMKLFEDRLAPLLPMYGIVPTLKGLEVESVPTCSFGEPRIWMS